jgi:hypothetical protein
VGESSLYPALQRLLLNGWVKGEWGESENHRRARYDSLTASGKKQPRFVISPITPARLSGVIASDDGQVRLTSKNSANGPPRYLFPRTIFTRSTFRWNCNAGSETMRIRSMRRKTSQF